MKENQDKVVFGYRFVQLFRTVTMCISLVIINSNSCIMIGFAFFYTLPVLIYIGLYRPLLERLDNHMGLINEFFMILCLYHFICFTDLVPKPEDRKYIGYSLNIVLGISLFINIAFSAVKIYRNTVFQCKKIKYLRKKKKLAKKRGNS